MRPKLLQLGKSTLIYGIGKISIKCMSFLLIPVYTRVFNPSDYGVIELVTVTMLIMGIILSAGTGTSFNYYFNEKKSSSSKSEILTSVLQWHILWGFIIIILSILIWPHLKKALYNNTVTIQIFLLAMLMMFFGQINSRVLDYYRLTFKPVIFVKISFLTTICSILMTLLFVVKYKLGILGFFAGSALGASIGLCVSFLHIRNILNWTQLHLKYWPKLLKFGIPLIPASVLTYLLNYSDRWFINYYLGSVDLGLYSFASKIGNITTIAIQIIMQAFLPFSMDLLHNEDQGEMNDLLSLTFRYFIGFALISILVITMLSPFITKVMAPPQYFNSFKLIGILSLPGFFFGLTYFSSLGTWQAKKTYLYTISTAIAAIVNIVLNVFLIPVYGNTGAAIATAIAMLSLVIFSFYFSNKLFKIEFNFHLAILQLGIAASALTIFILWTADLVDSITYYSFFAIMLCALTFVSVKKSEFFSALQLIQLTSRISR